jgi:hypothetical protein
VRRCERRIGELVREGQREGAIRGEREGGGPKGLVAHDGRDKRSAADVIGATHRSEVSPLYAMADAPAGKFEQAIGAAREEDSSALSVNSRAEFGHAHAKRPRDPPNSSPGWR